MKWNDRQRDAIESRGENLLVAAAAGSGKTAVLVERIIRLLRDEGRSLSEMLIVTFTQAAASEMKEKIYSALSAELAKAGKDPSEQRRLRAELSSVGRARISTFHSFALDIIRNYYHVAGIRPGLGVCDEASAALMMNEAMEELFADRFEAGDAGFTRFLDCYCSSKNNDAAMDMIRGFYVFLQSLPYPEKWMEELEEGTLFDADSCFSYAAEKGTASLNSAAACCEAACRLLAAAGPDGRGCPKLCEKLRLDIDAVNAAAAAISRDPSEESIALPGTIAWQRMVPTKDEKPAYETVKEDVTALRDAAKDIVKSFTKDWQGISPDLLRREHEALREPVGELCALTRDFAQRYAAKKDKKGVLDFSDIEHFSLRILQSPEVCDEYRSQLAYIFVDEYQDSNLVQEELISRVSRENNVFMVGDVKQSIYKFRLAEPEIFLSKYALFRSGGAERSRVIDLNRNYRSKAEVIDFVNLLFSRVMNRQSCGIEYDQDAALVKGDSYGRPLAYPVRLYIADSRKAEPAASDEAADSPDGAAPIDEEIEELRSDELEARLALKIIREYHGKPVWDSKAGAERPLRYGDMVILMRAVRGRGEVFYKTLSDAGLGVCLERGEGYFDTVEIQVFMALLRLIDNARRDVPLLSVLRSPVFGFCAAELADIRIYANSAGDRKMPYSRAFDLYCEEGSDPVLREKCRSFASKLAAWREESRYTPLADFLWKLMSSTGFLNYASALAGGEQRAANLRALADKAAQYESLDSGGLSGFINYVALLESRGTRIDTGQVRIFAEGSDSVRIMTIHKSKGLEFPFVLLTGLGKKLSPGPGRSQLRLSRRLGAGMRIVSPKLSVYNDPFLSRVIACEKEDEEYAESIRLLYVAMTRAKDIMVMSACVKDAGRQLRKSSLLPAEAQTRCSSYLEMVLPSMQPGSILITPREALDLAEEKKQSADLFKALENGFSPKLPDERKAEIAAGLSMRYEDLVESLEKRKYSVSQLAELERLGLGEGHRVLAADGEEDAAAERMFVPETKVPDFIAGKRPLSAAEKGTAYHRVMEHIPFEETYSSRQAAAEFIEGLRAKRILSDAEAAAVDPGRIAGFFRSDIGRRALASDMVRREAPFVMKHTHAGREVLVQGTIDCYFEEDGSYVLIDYKSNYVDRESPEEAVERLRGAYLPQLALYREALEKISGKAVKEGVLYLFSLGKEIRMER